MNKKQTVAKIFIATLGLILLIFTGCDNFGLDTLAIEEAEPDLGSINNSVGAANTQFGFNLFSEIRKTEQDKNIFISPFSVSVALAMTLNGASGETEQAMTNTLQLQGASSASINVGYAQLQQALQVSDPKVKLTIANSLWGRQGISFKPDFLQRNTQFFGAEISTLDFTDPSAPTTINQWVNTNTEGKIQKIIDQIDPSMVLFLINAIYFKGTWETEFDPSRTRERAFHLATGAEKQVAMMTRTDDYPYYRGEDFQAIGLPYGNGQMRMYIFLPDPESDLNAFSGSLDPENWESWMSQFHKREVSVVIPKFKMEYGTTLNDTLNALGMGIAFESELADFSRMASLDGNLYIAKIDHKAVIEVNEEGTVAAAATSVGIGVTSLPPPPIHFIADRPFFFAIRDNETKTMLFMGVVMEP